MSAEVVVVLPEASDDMVSSNLRFLTQVLVDNGLGDPDYAGGLLGGEYGYGTPFENDVFMLHPYCWCGREDCQWCAGCECPDSAFHYFVDGAEVTWDEWMAFYQREVGDGPGYDDPAYDDWVALCNATNKRRLSSSDKVCRVCRGEFGNAPNFLHKPSGSSVRWYKWIGRSMEVDLKADWSGIFIACLQSLSTPPSPVGHDQEDRR